MPLDWAELRIPFYNTYVRLFARFYARVEPTQVALRGLSASAATWPRCSASNRRRWTSICSRASTSAPAPR